MSSENIAIASDATRDPAQAKAVLEWVRCALGDDPAGMDLALGGLDENTRRRLCKIRTFQGHWLYAELIASCRYEALAAFLRHARGAPARERLRQASWTVLRYAMPKCAAAGPGALRARGLLLDEDMLSPRSRSKDKPDSPERLLLWALQTSDIPLCEDLAAQGCDPLRLPGAFPAPLLALASRDPAQTLAFVLRRFPGAPFGTAAQACLLLDRSVPEPDLFYPNPYAFPEARRQSIFDALCRARELPPQSGGLDALLLCPPCAAELEKFQLLDAAPCAALRSRGHRSL